MIERSPSGGWHVVYRCQTAPCGNIKLAERAVPVTSDQEVEFYGRKYKPRKENGRHEVWLTLIETRAEGGLFLCAPTPGYELVQGRFEELPVLTDQEREVLLEVAWSLNELRRAPEPIPAPATGLPASGRPGDDYNARGDVRDVLRKHGWTLARGGENEYWRRPGKTDGWSATLKDGVFYVHSSNAAPFEPGRPYGPFGVYTLLEHGGDFGEAASCLRREGFGDQVPQAACSAPVPLVPACEAIAREPQLEDPGPAPEEMLRVPGFVSEVMDLCLKTAPYPNQAITFGGALALQAFLAGRKVRDSGDNRTNIYLLGLAHSAAGKDWIRKVNAKIVHAVGMSSCLGDRLASGQGVEDALFVHPLMLFQTDEIDGLVQSINRATDARYESIMTTLLTVFSASNSILNMRPKADKPNPGSVNQPHLVLFGTAVPNHYYEALSERMLTNGFFARNIVLEAGKRGAGQEPGIIEISDRVLDTAKWWANFRPGPGNLEHWNPEPVIVEATEEARQRLREVRIQAEAKYAQAEERNDAVGTTVWGRVAEQTRKLALIYAASENHLEPSIGIAAVEWASAFVTHQTNRMLFMASLHVSDNDFEAKCLKFVQKLRAAPGNRLAHSVALKRMKMDAKRFRELVETLEQRGDIRSDPVISDGRHGVAYSLTAA